jgi:hypothetical protein
MRIGYVYKEEKVVYVLMGAMRAIRDSWNNTILLLVILKNE